jgi:hypothetical protein
LEFTDSGGVKERTLLVRVAVLKRNTQNKLEATMQRGLIVILLAIVIAVGYGVAFSMVYPLVSSESAEGGSFLNRE